MKLLLLVPALYFVPFRWVLIGATALLLWLLLGLIVHVLFLMPIFRRNQDRP